MQVGSRIELNIKNGAIWSEATDSVFVARVRQRKALPIDLRQGRSTQLGG